MSNNVVLLSGVRGGSATMLQWRVSAVACLVGFLLVLGSPVNAADKPDAPDNIKELKEQRLALLLKVQKLAKDRRAVDPTVPLQEVQKAMAEVVAARLDLAETSQARVKVHEDAVKQAGEWEEVVKGYFKAGALTPGEVAKAQAYVMECRIALAKARAQSENKQPKDTTAPEDAALLKKRVVLARKAYFIVERTLGEVKRVAPGQSISVIQPEEVYTWSVRLLQAERDMNPRDAVAAVEGHIKRIKELEKKVKMLVPEVLPHRAEFDVDWYRLEAQHWLAEAKARAQNKDIESGQVKKTTIEDDLKGIRDLLRMEGSSGPYFEENATTRLDEWRALADKGSREAQWFLGRCHELGYGVRRDRVAAEKWMRKSADQGFALAQNNLAMLDDNRAVPVEINPRPRPTPSPEVELYRKAADQGEPIAQINLARRYETGLGVKADIQQAIRLYTRAADKNYVIAIRRLAAIYEQGLAEKADGKEAARWYRKASDLGDGSSTVKLFLMYEDGIGVEKDPAEAKRLLELARKQLGDDPDEVLPRARCQMIAGTWQIQVNDGKERYLVTLLLNCGEQRIGRSEPIRGEKPLELPPPREIPDGGPMDLIGTGQLYVFRPENEANTKGKLTVAGLAYKVEKGRDGNELVLGKCALLPDNSATIEFVLSNGKLKLKSGKVLRSKEDKIGLDVKGEWRRLHTPTPYGNTFANTGRDLEVPDYSSEK